jgi:hypothetical protein
VQHFSVLQVLSLNICNNKAHNTKKSYLQDHSTQTQCAEQTYSLIQNFKLRTSSDICNVPLAGSRNMYLNAEYYICTWWFIVFEQLIAETLTNPTRMVLFHVNKSLLKQFNFCLFWSLSRNWLVTGAGKTEQRIATVLLHGPKVLQVETVPQISI